MTSSSQRSKIILAAILFAILAVVTVVVVATADDEARVPTDTSVKPIFEPPPGEPPTELVINDVVEGDGATAKKGDQLNVQYVGIDYATGEQFDASWDSGQPLPLQLGAGQVISGWDEGIEGMKVGGRRELIIPPDLGLRRSGPATRHRPERDSGLRHRPARRPGGRPRRSVAIGRRRIRPARATTSSRSRASRCGRRPGRRGCGASPAADRDPVCRASASRVASGP